MAMSVERASLCHCLCLCFCFCELKEYTRRRKISPLAWECPPRVPLFAVSPCLTKLCISRISPPLQKGNSQYHFWSHNILDIDNEELVLIPKAWLFYDLIWSCWCNNKSRLPNSSTQLTTKSHLVLKVVFKMGIILCVVLWSMML